jgi:hypothetical protein
LPVPQGTPSLIEGLEAMQRANFIALQPGNKAKYIW